MIAEEIVAAAAAVVASVGRTFPERRISPATRALMLPEVVAVRSVMVTKAFRPDARHKGLPNSDHAFGSSNCHSARG